MSQNYEFNEIEQEIWNWYSEEEKKFALFTLLSDEDKKIFDDAIKIQDNEELVVRSRTNYVKMFYNEYKNKFANEPKYNFEQVMPVVLKKVRQMHYAVMKEPTKETEIASYVFSKMLTKEEQDGFRRPTFQNNRHLSEKAVNNYANYFVDWLIKLNLLAEDKREEKQKEIYNDRFSRLLLAYK